MRLYIFVPSQNLITADKGESKITRNSPNGGLYYVRSFSLTILTSYYVLSKHTLSSLSRV